jgi:hypothetical protein
VHLLQPQCKLRRLFLQPQSLCSLRRLHRRRRRRRCYWRRPLCGAFELSEHLHHLYGWTDLPEELLAKVLEAAGWQEGG